ncbi:hypothetical protein QFZ32_004435 [Streptomyces canus]|nr:hypothetical protein [Streptomyces canus]
METVARSVPALMSDQSLRMTTVPAAASGAGTSATVMEPVRGDRSTVFTFLPLREGVTATAERKAQGHEFISETIQTEQYPHTAG